MLNWSAGKFLKELLEFHASKSMASRFDCESSIFNPFLVKDNLINNEVDPDAKFFQDIPSLHPVQVPGKQCNFAPGIKTKFKDFREKI